MIIQYDSCWPLLDVNRNSCPVPFEEFMIRHMDAQSGLQVCQICGQDVSCIGSVYQVQTTSGIPECENDWTCSACYGAVWFNGNLSYFTTDWNDGLPGW